MKPARHDAIDIPDVTSHLAGSSASPGPFPPEPFSGPGHRQVNARVLRDRELTRVRPLSALALPSRITNALLRSGINSVGQLISRSREDLITEITGLGEKSLKIIETALALENLALAPPETLPSAFTRASTSRALSSAKNHRHIKNHNTWVTSTDASPGP
ncbi:DNA-directed RNA polymerase subunit alpha C-terminal domain-containing protein [Pseudarthrobacter sp. B907]|uniref:DNA-directed RNA polymerase subunit alpha C-terminal domain-containing protein n=1 Tax=Pseudarthrobacter sp. B907 TaxID=3158261 RepID=UPI0032DBEA59